MFLCCGVQGRVARLIFGCAIGDGRALDVVARHGAGDVGQVLVPLKRVEFLAEGVVIHLDQRAGLQRAFRTPRRDGSAAVDDDAFAPNVEENGKVVHVLGL